MLHNKASQQSTEGSTDVQHPGRSKTGLAAEHFLMQSCTKGLLVLSFLDAYIEALVSQNV